jgi:hypothetical protein
MANKASYSIIISSRAQKEISQSWEWYEDRLQGLGDRFVNEIIDRIRLIERNPERYPTRFKSYKETPITCFPLPDHLQIKQTKENCSDRIRISYFT